MFSTPTLKGRRVLVTGAARGIGALLSERLHLEGARVALLGLEPELLEDVAGRCGDAPWFECDIADREHVEVAVEAAVAALGGLDVFVANAGIAAQLPLLGGDPTVMERTIAVNLIGSYYTIRAAGPHISHPGGYALLVSSMASAVHLPLMGAYSASKAGVEALGNTLRIELSGTGAKVGVAYFSELDTDMTSRGFGTEAAKKLVGDGAFTRITPVEVAIRSVTAGIARRSRRIVVPRQLVPVLPTRMLAQRVIDVAARRNLRAALEIARRERVDFTTPQPTDDREATVGSSR
ncbi:MAG: SDR family NAD(P)-dependent oxidoreductase [Acidimicrobiales bacterium]|nr:SDR family NAD(P)-dependent oxidoreductase [Acidimicrobiales bacterium]